MAYVKIFESWDNDFAWRDRNCKVCSKSFGFPPYPKSGCKIETALLKSFFGDGELSDDIKEQMGYNGSPDFRCKEYDVITQS